MELQLIEGAFSRKDLIDVISRMIDVKIRYHEDKIEASSNEYDIEMREQKIRQLQDSMHTCRLALQGQGDVLATAKIHLNT